MCSSWVEKPLFFLICLQGYALYCSPSGAPHERTEPLYAWGLPGDKRTRHRLALCPLQPSAAPAQARSAVGPPSSRSCGVIGGALAKTPMAALACRGMALYVPLVVLMLVKPLNARWKRMCRRMWWHGCSLAAKPPPIPRFRIIPITRAYAALGTGRLEEVNALPCCSRWPKTVALPMPASVVGNTTAQELPIGYLTNPGSYGGRSAVAAPWRGSKPRRWWESIRPWHRCRRSSGQSKNTTSLPRANRPSASVDAFTHRGGAVDRADTPAGPGLGSRRDRVTQHALTTLQTVHEVAKRLIPQIVQWITTGVGGQGQNPPCGCDAGAGAGAPQGGKEVERLVCRIF